MHAIVHVNTTPNVGKLASKGQSLLHVHSCPRHGRPSEVLTHVARGKARHEATSCHALSRLRGEVRRVLEEVIHLRGGGREGEGWREGREEGGREGREEGGREGRREREGEKKGGRKREGGSEGWKRGR